MNGLLVSLGIQDRAFFWTIVFGLIGLIGSAVGLLSWWDSRKTKRVNSYILELAERNLDKSVTEQQLDEKKAEVAAVSKRMQELQEQIQRDIPVQARRAVLLDRLNTQTELLRSYLSSTKQLQAELASLGELRTVQPDLLRAIEAEISPEYLLRERRSSLKTQLTITTSAAAIISTLLPSPLDRFLSWPLLIAAIPVLILLVRASLPGATHARRRIIRKVAAWVLIVAALPSLAFGGMLLFFGATSAPDPDMLLLGVFGIICAVALAASGVWLSRRTKESASTANPPTPISGA
jgi:hypothetical protein